MPLFANSRLVVFKGWVFPAAPVWGEGSIALAGSPCFLFPGEGREEVAVGAGRKIPCSGHLCLLEKLGISVAGLGVKCCLNSLEWTALERDGVWGLNLLLFCLSSKFEILRFREVVWMEAFACLPIRFPLLSCPFLPAWQQWCQGPGQGGPGGGCPERPGVGRERPGVLGGPPGLSGSTAFRFSSPKDCKEGANSLKRSINSLSSSVSSWPQVSVLPQ